MLQPRLASLARRRAKPIPRCGLAVEAIIVKHRRPYSTPSSDEGATRIRRIDPTQPKKKAINYAAKPVEIPVNGQTHIFAGTYLRDLCKCQKCRDSSTRQKLQLTANIELDASAASVDVNGDAVSIVWNVNGKNAGLHVTELSIKELAHLAGLGDDGPMPNLPSRRPWLDDDFRSEAQDITFDAYMQDDSILLKALRQLQTHGLVFLTKVPDSSDSVSQIAERIGPLKNTFYGMTWDVRSVQGAKNVAYTSQDLGFHMDLLYMKQPPHLQFLHCIRSSAQGGASLFSDTYRAVQDMYINKPAFFQTLTEIHVPYHYDHADAEPTGHYYHHAHPVISLEPLRFVDPHETSLSVTFPDVRRLGNAAGRPDYAWTREHFTAHLPAYITSVAWSPPFQAPFATTAFSHVHPDTVQALEQGFGSWRRAARSFDAVLHQQKGIHERMMKPGECVLFDNTRIVHARKAFIPGDEGSERWLRGAYVDRDPYESRLKVLLKKEMEEKGSMDELGAPHWLPDAL
nr:hypothetical protein B0A51_08347 [Rachicladosporium sp. CCFEE 5018]